MPDIGAHWDKTEVSIQFNDIRKDIVSAGLHIYSCSLEEMWSGLYKPSVYEANTLWSRSHDSGKIAKVIDAWVQERALSPIFLVKHLKLDLGLVADGKHRLTVSHAIEASEVPFMVESTNESWVCRAFPSASRLI